MSLNDSTWIKVAESVTAISFGANGIAEVEVVGKRLCMAIYKEKLVAFAHTCPHAGGYLVDGFIDALGNVVCPLHHYKFCVNNGRNVSGEGYYLKHWPVEVRSDGVYVAFEEKLLFG